MSCEDCLAFPLGLVDVAEECRTPPFASGQDGCQGSTTMQKFLRTGRSADVRPVQNARLRMASSEVMSAVLARVVDAQICERLAQKAQRPLGAQAPADLIASL